MDEFLRDNIWQFVGAILGLIAIFISVGIYFAQRTRKRLAYEIVSTTAVVSTTDEVDGKIQISFEGKPVKKVHLLIIKLTNIGNVPITTNDYERAISIVFNENVQILSQEILETIPANLKAEIEISDNSIMLKPTLLNSGDAMAIKSLLSDFDDEIKIDGRIIGVKTIEKQKKNSFPYSGIFYLVGVVSIGFSISLSTSENNSFGLFFFAIGMILFFASLIKK